MVKLPAISALPSLAAAKAPQPAHAELAAALLEPGGTWAPVQLMGTEAPEGVGEGDWGDGTARASGLNRVLMRHEPWSEKGTQDVDLLEKQPWDVKRSRLAKPLAAKRPVLPVPAHVAPRVQLAEGPYGHRSLGLFGLLAWSVVAVAVWLSWWLAGKSSLGFFARMGMLHQAARQQTMHFIFERPENGTPSKAITATGAATDTCSTSEGTTAVCTYDGTVTTLNDGAPSHLLLHAPFEVAAATHPHTTAVLAPFGIKLASFGDLDVGATRLMHWLHREGLAHRAPVAVAFLMTPRGETAPTPPPHELHVTALLAVLKCGSPYVPIDLTAWPKARQRFVLEDSGATHVLTDAMGGPDSGPGMALRVGGSSDGLPDRHLWLSGTSSPVLRVLNVVDLPVVELGTPMLEVVAGPDDLCHVLYTSGSSGQPKGVLTAHRAAASRCRWMRAAFPFRPGEVGIAKTPLCFVDHVWETFGPLGSAIPLCEFPHAARGDCAFLLSALRMCNVSRLVLTPTLARRLLDEVLRYEGVGLPSSLMQVTLSGEPLPGTLLHEVLAAMPSGSGSSVLNLYGCTEVAGDVTFHQWLRDEHVVAWSASGLGMDVAAPSAVAPLGSTIPGCEIRVLNPDNLTPVARGTRGEIVVLGVHLAQGYVHPHDPGARDRFLSLPGDGARAFRTGDFGYQDDSGTLWYCGREDDVVKIRGERVELQEVQAVLQRFGGLHGGGTESSGPSLVQDGLASMAHRALAEIAPGASFSQAVVVPYMEPGAPSEHHLAVVLAVPRQCIVVETLQARVEDTVRAALSKVLPTNAVPARVLLLNSETESALLPRLPSGKVDRKALQVAAEAGAEAARAHPSSAHAPDSLGLTRAWSPQAIEAQRLVNSAYVVLTVLVIQSHFWGDEGIHGDAWQDAHVRVANLSYDLAMPGFMFLAAVNEVLESEAALWPKCKDGWILLIFLAMEWPLGQLSTGFFGLLGGRGAPQLVAWSGPNWFLASLLWSRAILGAGRMLSLPGRQHVALVIALGVLMQAWLLWRPLSMMQLCTDLPKWLLHVLAPLGGGRGLIPCLHDPKSSSTFLGLLRAHIVWALLKLTAPWDMVQTWLPQVYILTYYGLKLDTTQRVFRAVSSWLRGGASGGIGGWRDSLVGLLLLSLFWMHCFHGFAPGDYGITREGLPNHPIWWSFLMNCYYCALDTVGFAALLMGLATLPKARIEVLGRYALGSYVFHGFFVRSVSPCDELPLLHNAPAGCTEGTKDPMFGGLWLFGLEVVPTPCAALYEWQRFLGGALGTVLRDAGGALLLWAYPLLFMCTFGPLFQSLLSIAACPSSCFASFVRQGGSAGTFPPRLPRLLRRRELP